MSRVLIVGATSTVAMDVARLLKARGAEFLLLARDEARLAALATELAPQVLATRAVDFSNLRATEICLSDLLAHGSIDLVLIAQGYLGDQRRSELSFDEAERQILVNFTSVVSQLIVVGAVLEGQGSGHIVVLSSVAGDRGRPRNYTYGAAKGALNVYLQGLRSRLWPRVAVTTVKLGPVDTRMSAGHQRNITFTSSPSAARGIVSAIERRRKEVYVPGFYAVIMMIVRVLPELIFQRLSFLSGR